MRIANRVRALRTEQGLTLDALAAKCEVSCSMISLIERGESSPTAVVLEKIATGLGVALASLFEDVGEAVNPVSRREDRTTWRDPQSGYVKRAISRLRPSHHRSRSLRLSCQQAQPSPTRPAHVNRRSTSRSGCRRAVSRSRLAAPATPWRADDCFAMVLNEPYRRFATVQTRDARYLVVIATERGRGTRR